MSFQIEENIGRVYEPECLVIQLKLKNIPKDDTFQNIKSAIKTLITAYELDQPREGEAKDGRE